MKEFIIKEENKLPKVAEALLPMLNDTAVLCFYGEMGAGKTTFIKVICTLLGVSDVMSSPTFSIVNEYQTDKGSPVYHFDFYRLEDQQEALGIGVEEYFYSGEVCLIEWPEKIIDLIPDEHIKININLVGTNDRKITITVND